MKNAVSILLFLFASQMLLSQNTRAAREFFSLKITPTALLNPARPTILIGAEFKLKPKLGLHIEHGFQFTLPYDIIAGGEYYYFRQERHFKRTKIELRRHTFLGGWAAHYQAFGVMHYFEEYDARPGSIRFRDGRHVSQSSAKIFQTEWGGYFLFGSKVWTDDHVYIDIYAGMGGRRITIDYGYVNVTGMLPPKEVPKRGFFDGQPGHFYEGSVWQFFVDCGLKFGYSF